MKLWKERSPDIPRMLEKRDIDGIIDALRHSDATIQWQAADALGKLGQEGVDHLIAALNYKNREVKLGVIEALGRYGIPGRSRP
jgi:hypothetical protein